ncbi:MAG: asparagine synthase [Legionella sp.]|nr:asparagine synthase [Legionella sp.]
MSAIGAIFSIQNKPIDEASLQALHHGMARHGKHGSNTWFSNTCGLTQQSYYHTLSTQLASFPYFDKKHNIGLVADVRLSNRTDLHKSLHASFSHQYSDAELIILAYLTWGIDFILHLVGEFSLILWDTKLHRFVVAVDHFNTRPLYYFFNQDFLIISSVLSALHHVPWVPREPNLSVIARHDFKRFLLEPGETCFKHLYFLPPANLLIADPSGIKFHTYWRPTLGAPYAFKSDNDFQEAFHEHFSNAVHATVDTDRPVCLQLSGGLDSSAIALMAANVLGFEQKKLICLSNVLPPNSHDSLNDEHEYIDLIHAPNLIKETVIDPWRGPFDHLDACKTHLYTSPQHYQHRAINAAARRHQASVVLHGTLAELTTSYSGHERLSELFHRLHWITLIRELFAHRKIYKTSSLSLAALVIHPKILHGYLKKRQHSTRQKLLTASLINPTFILEQMTPDALMWLEQQFLKPLILHSMNARKNALIQIESHLRHASTLFTQLDDGIDSALYFSNPYFDKRLVEFCLNIPNAYRFRHGYPRSIIRLGMQKYLPKAIGQRITKSPFLPDYHVRYHQHMSKAREAIEAVQSHPLVQHVIDVPRLLSCLNTPSSSHALSTETNFLNYYVIPQAVYLAVFLSSFS